MRVHIETAEFQGGKLEYATENFDNLFPEMIDMFTAQYLELAPYKEHIQLVPDLAKYRLLEQADNLACFTVRLNGKLIGYSLYFVDMNIHYSDNLFAVNDIIYLKPEFRKGRIALRLIAYSEVRLRSIGVSVTAISMKTKAGFERLLEFAGYNFQEKLYTKYIG